MPLQDVQQFCPPEDIHFTKSGHMKIKKEVALKNMESQLLISQPGTRNNDKIKLSHFYTTAAGEKPIFGGTRGQERMSNSLEHNTSVEESTTDVSNLGNGLVPSEDKRHYRIQQNLYLNGLIKTARRPQ